MKVGVFSRLLLAVLVLYSFKLFSQSPDVLANELADKAEEINGKASLPHLDEAFLLCSENKCSDTTLARLYQRKSVAYYLGYIDDDLALSFADSTISYYKKALGERDILIGNSYFNKGVMLNDLGSHIEAKHHVDIALEKLPYNTNLDVVDSISANWYLYSAMIERRLGDYYSAKLKLKNGLSNAYNVPSIKMKILIQLGLIYLDTYEFEKARDIYESIITPDDIAFSSLTGNYGLSLLYNNQLDKGSIALHRAHGGYMRFKYNNSNRAYVKRSNSHANLLQLYLGKQGYDKAEHHYSEALRLLLEVDSTGRLPRFAEIYFKKGKLEHALGNYDSSLAFLERAMQVVAPELKTTGADENISIIGPFKRVLELIGFRARVLASQGEYQLALQDVALLNRLITQSRRSYQSSLSKYFLVGQVMPIYELGIQLNHQLYRQTGDRQYLEQAYAYNAHNKAILLLESIQSDRAMTFAKLPLSVQEEEKALRDALIEQERLLYVAYQKEKPLDSLQNVVFEQEQAYNQFIQQLETEYPAYYDLKYSADRPPVIADIQQQLEGDQAMVEYFLGQDSLYTFLFDGSDMQVFSTATPAGLTDSIALFRELITNGIERDCQKTFIGLGRFFYDLLLAQPLAELRASQNRLVIVPDGLLNYLSFEAFIYKPLEKFRGAEGFLIEKYACSYAYSSKLLTENDYYPRSATKGFGGFGTEYDDATLNYLQEIGFTGAEKIDSTTTLPCGHTITDTRYLGPLSFSDDEVRNIAAIIDGDTWLNEDVTKNRFLEVAKDYNLLHLSMHGTYDLEFPMNSSLIFTHTDSSEVFLRAGEIYGMELTGEMAVLSACNTGYGKLEIGEGPMTLARAFHYAGIPSVVASLWSIPDNSSSHIMKLFYEELADGYPKDIALQRAKLAYMSDDDISSPATRQPIHWAPSIVIGSVEPIKIGNGISWGVWLALSVAALGIFLVFFNSRKKGGSLTT